MNRNIGLTRHFFPEILLDARVLRDPAHEREQSRASGRSQTGRTFRLVAAQQDQDGVGRVLDPEEEIHYGDVGVRQLASLS